MSHGRQHRPFTIPATVDDRVRVPESTLNTIFQQKKETETLLYPRQQITGMGAPSGNALATDHEKVEIIETMGNETSHSRL